MTKGQKYLFHLAWILWTALSLFLFPGQVVSADCGPKAELHLTVQHPPDGAYAVGLLRDYGDDLIRCSDWGSNADTTAEHAMELYQKDGWALSTWQDGTTPNSAVYDASKGSHTYDFLYPPSEFRVILATENGEVWVSETMTTVAYCPSVQLDVEKLMQGRSCVTEQYGTLRANMLWQLGFTYVATVVIEGILWLCFRMPRRKIWVFFLANAVTQLGLYVCLICFSVLGALAVLLAEMLILLAEMVIYRRTLKDVKGGRIIAYAITANLTSFLLSFPLNALIALVPPVHLS